MLTIVRNKPTYKSGLEQDGTPLNLLPASKNTFTEITDISASFSKSDDNIAKIKVLYKLLTIVLNNNDAGVTVTDQEVEAIDPLTAATIIKEYTAFMRGLQNDPN